MDAYKDAMIHNDAATLDKLLGDDLPSRTRTESFKNKAAVLKSVTTGPNVITQDGILRLQRQDLWKHRVGERPRGSLAPRHHVVHMDILHVWVKGAGGWQLVARQATRLAQ